MITFKQERQIWPGEADSTISYVVDGEENLNDIMQHFRRFLMAAGYHPDSISDYIEAE